MYGGHYRGQDPGRDGLIVYPPVTDQLGPARPRRLLCRYGWQFIEVRSPAPVVEKLTMLRDPWPGVHGPGQVLLPAEPAGRIAGQARGPDEGHAGSGVLAQVRPEQLVVQWLTRFLGAGMSVRVNQPWQQPAFARQLSMGNRVGGPSVTVGIQVEELAAGQGIAAHAQDAHVPIQPQAAGLSRPARRWTWNICRADSVSDLRCVFAPSRGQRARAVAVRAVRFSVNLFRRCRRLLT